MNKFSYATGAYLFKPLLESKFGQDLSALHEDLETFNVDTDQSSKYHKIFYDLPEDHEFFINFKKFVIEINTRMTDEEIIDKLTYFLHNEDIRQECVDAGKKWAEGYTQEKYSERFVKML